MYKPFKNHTNGAIPKAEEANSKGCELTLELSALKLTPEDDKQEHVLVLYIPG